MKTRTTHGSEIVGQLLPDVASIVLSGPDRPTVASGSVVQLSASVKENNISIPRFMRIDGTALARLRRRY
jgi:hypothetical protein